MLLLFLYLLFGVLATFVVSHQLLQSVRHILSGFASVFNLLSLEGDMELHSLRPSKCVILTFFVTSRIPKKVLLVLSVPFSEAYRPVECRREILGKQQRSYAGSILVPKRNDLLAAAGISQSVSASNCPLAASIDRITDGLFDIHRYWYYRLDVCDGLMLAVVRLIKDRVKGRWRYVGGCSANKAPQVFLSLTK
jgi:hypothetical protein